MRNCATLQKSRKSEMPILDDIQSKSVSLPYFHIPKRDINVINNRIRLKNFVKQ